MMAASKMIHYGDCEIHGAGVVLGGCGMMNSKPIYYCTECGDAPKSLNLGYHGGEISNIRSLTVKAVNHTKQCDGRCTNGKHSCDCKCHGRCHGAGQCFC